MSSSKSLRRSGRVRVPTTKYGDALIDLKDEILDLEAEGPKEDSDNDAAHDSGSAEDEYSANGEGALASEETSSELDEISDTGIGHITSTAKQAQAGKTAKRTASGTTKSPLATRVEKSAQPSNQPQQVRNRGLSVVSRLPDLRKVIPELYGTDEQDFKRVVGALGCWSSDLIAPSRTNLIASHEHQNEQDGREEREVQAREAWSWYIDREGAKKMLDGQLKQPIRSANIGEYYPKRLGHHKAALGPHWKQTLFEVRLEEPLHLVEPWKPAREENTQPQKNIERNGWILNLGARIHQLEWVPHRSGDTQYLATTIWHSAPNDAQSSTAFEPSPPYKACIQIWAFYVATASESAYQTLDTERRPQLVHTICGLWGMCLDMRWCPEAPNRSELKSDEIHLGLLAATWSDGYVRVLDIRIPKHHRKNAVHVLYQGSAFAARPPQSICTAVTWVTSTDIAVGCAHGQVALWDVASAVASPEPESPGSNAAHTDLDMGPTPYMVRDLHHGYILQVAACFPSHPYLLFSMATDGYIRLTDLRNPDFETVFAVRTRLYSQCFAYSPLIQAMLVPEGQATVSFLPLRRVFSRTAPLWYEASITAVACSPVHTCNLIGLADGSVVLNNSVKRIFEARKLERSLEVKWFKHEWMPENGVGSTAWQRKYTKKQEQEQDGDGNITMLDALGSDETVSGSATAPRDVEGNQNLSNDDEELPLSALRSGISRITEAYRPAPRASKPSATPSKQKSGGKDDGRRAEVMYEEASAISALAWNPNVLCGGWAAAGMGSGMLRVEDLAV